MIGIKYILELNEELWQYDIGRRLIVPQLVSGEKPEYSTQFYSKNHEINITSDKYILETEYGIKKYFVEIPKELLYDDGVLEVYAFNKSNGIAHTETLTKFEITERPIPKDIAYTPEQIRIWDTKQDKLIAGDNINITNNIISAVGSGYGTTDHSKLTNLDYKNSGHTGFQKQITSTNKLPYNLISNTPNLATVATTGSYVDLTNKPNTDNIPTDTERAYWNEKADVSDIPTETSQLNNDSGFITRTDLTDEYATKNYVNSITNTKQNLITESNPLSYTLITDKPTDLSQFTNNGTVGGIKYATESKFSDYRTASNQDIIDTEIKEALNIAKNNIDIIKYKIPVEASYENKLADKSYVEKNRGKFIPKSDTETFFTSKEDLEAYTGELNNNDFAIVQGVESDSSFYDYYQVTISTNESTKTWNKLYRLDGASFTETQWAAINSRITESLVSTISAHVEDEYIHISDSDRENWNNKMSEIDTLVYSGLLEEKPTSTETRKWPTDIVEDEFKNIANGPIRIISRKGTETIIDEQTGEEKVIEVDLEPIRFYEITKKPVWGTAYKMPNTEIEETEKILYWFYANPEPEPEPETETQTNASAKDNPPERGVLVKDTYIRNGAWEYTAYSPVQVYTTGYDSSMLLEEFELTKNLETDVAAKGFTKNKGTVTGIVMNGVSKGTEGIVDLGTVLTEHQSLAAYRTSEAQDIIDSAIKADIIGINEKIPNEATKDNKLTDKDFVNSSIATNTATFRGTSAPGLTEEQFLAWANTLTKTKNDYVFWNTTDSIGNVIFKRYKFDDTNWLFEYELNNSSFTASQWASINSGITSGLVGEYNTHIANSTIHVTAEEKQNIADNTTARHTHTNSSILDSITSELITSWNSTVTWITTNGSNILSHLSDTVKHITEAERTSWNSTVTWITTNGSNILSHLSDTVKHITEAERTEWTAKYSKPSDGIPKTDLSSSVQSSLEKADTALQEHQSLAAYRTSAEEDIINATKVDKIEGKGLSTNDYTTNEKNKLSSIADGAEVNVQSNWSQTDTSKDDYIKNKPSSFPPSTHTHNDTQITWGGNMVGDVDPVVMGCIDEFGHNKLAFLPANCIQIHYTTDGGTTWIDYGLSDNEKIKTVSTNGTSKYIGGSKDGITAENITQRKIRVRIACGYTDKVLKLYTNAKKWLINISTNGATGCKVAVRDRTIANYLSGTETWVDKGTYSITGWPAWNEIPASLFGGYMNNQTNQVGQREFVFSATGITSDYNSALAVLDFRLIGSSNWTIPSEMARTGHLYTVEASQNATFPSGINASTFNGHTINKSVPADAKFTDTIYSAGTNITIDKNNVISATGETDHSKLSNLDYEHSGHIGFAPEEHTHSQYLIDAPSDSKLYARKNGNWSEVTSGSLNHSQLSNLDYENSGHTGFAPAIHDHSIADLEQFAQAPNGYYIPIAETPDGDNKKINNSQLKTSLGVPIIHTTSPPSENEIVVDQINNHYILAKYDENGGQFITDYATKIELNQKQNVINATNQLYSKFVVGAGTSKYFDGDTVEKSLDDLYDMADTMKTNIYTISVTTESGTGLGVLEFTSITGEQNE